MIPRSRAIVLRRAAPPTWRVLAAELRLGALLFEVTALEAQVERASRELAVFEAQWREATGPAFAELDRAQRLLRRVRRLEEEVQVLLDRLARGPAVAHGEVVARARAAPRAAGVGGGRPAARGSARGGARAPPISPRPAPVLEGGEDLKAIYRRLARALHPDLASGDDEERARRSELMARANAAYRRGDRAALELLAERVGAAAPEAEGSEPERLRDLSARIARVERARAALRRETEQLASSSTSRLMAEAPLRALQGGDLLEEARADIEREEEETLEEALQVLSRIPALSRALAKARRASLSRQPGATRGRSPWDPVAESALVRRTRIRRDRRRTAAAARAFTVSLERLAGAAPAEAALVVLAFLLESSARPPDPLASWSLLRERWEALRAAWSAPVPPLGRALALLPRHLEFGLRLRGPEVDAGLQLASPELAEGVRSALQREPVRELAQQLLAALGPRERCPRCGDVYAVHLVRVHGLDEVHGLACPSCASVLKSFRRYGEARGAESLSEAMVQVGLVAEQPVRLVRTVLAFQMLPMERNRLTARTLVRRFEELCLAPHGLQLARGALAVRAGEALLAPGARVPEGVPLAFVATPGTRLREAELLGEVRRRVRERFGADRVRRDAPGGR